MFLKISFIMSVITNEGVEEMAYIIGVDSGGTSTKAAAYDLNGQLLKEVKTGFGNLLNNTNQALVNLRESLMLLFEALGEENCELIVLGVAGVDSGGFRETIERDLSQFSPELVILNDAWMAHYALLNGQDGCLVISGTGSIVIGKFEGNEGRVGGYGNLLGDEGSGYGIAQKLIKATLNAYDEGRKLSTLEQQLLKRGNFESVFDLVKFVYASSKDQVADLSMVVVEGAQNDDAQALEILEKTGRELADQVVLLVKKLGMEKAPKVAVTGSVLLKNDLVYAVFEETVKEKYPDCSFIRKDISNTIGGFYYYQIE